MTVEEGPPQQQIHTSDRLCVCVCVSARARVRDARANGSESTGAPDTVRLKAHSTFRSESRPAHRRSSYQPKEVVDGVEHCALVLAAMSSPPLADFVKSGQSSADGRAIGVNIVTASGK